jgi:hypothetical protein
MPQLINAQQVVVKDGELIVHLTLDMNININSSDNVSVSTKAANENPEWEVPTFKSTPKVKFGKIGGEK